MVEEKKKKNKGTTVVIIILILIILGLGGYIVYDKVLKEEPVKVEEPKEEVVEQPDFYDVSELVKNNYIEKIDTTETDYIKISDGKIMVKSIYYDVFKEIGGVEGTPKYVGSYGICSDCQGLAYIVLTEEGNVYYSEDDFEMQGVPNFKKVSNEHVVNLYFSGLYPQYRFYAETIDGDLIRIDKDGMNSANTFEKDNFYVDYVYRPQTGGAIAMRLDKDGKLYKNENVEIKYNNNNIFSKEVFAENDGESPVYYIISKDNKIYKYENDKIELYTEKVFDNYAIISENKELGSVDIKFTYQDGSSENMVDMFATSTIYERANK